MAPNTCNAPCREADCASVFSRVMVYPTIQHGSRVEWRVLPQFDVAGSRVFQLQVGTTGMAAADDWEDVGSPVGDTFFAIDPTQRVFGQIQWTHYRVKLTVAGTTYYSQPAHALGALPQAAWRIYRNTMRLWEKQLRGRLGGQRGFLLKRKITGEQPTGVEAVTDYLTGELLEPQAAATVGTEYLGGYYEPVPCVYALLSTKQRRESRSENRGQEDPIRTAATLLAVPQLGSYDVWVSAANDIRWCLHTIKNKVEVRGVPVVVEAELRQLPFTDPAYAIEMPT